jgi:hypothetical protein
MKQIGISEQKSCRGDDIIGIVSSMVALSSQYVKSSGLYLAYT